LKWFLCTHSEAPSMYTLVDRANGTVLTTIQDPDFQLLQTNLEAESADDYDFYINEATLDYLREQGLSEEVVGAFKDRLLGRGMDVGWERETEDKEELHTGTVVDDEGQPLGGIRVDLMDRSAAETGKLQGERVILDWTYSRLDGKFTLEATKEAPGTQLRFSGRGDLVLAAGRIQSIGEQGEFTIQTVTGTVKTSDEEVLSGVSVQLLSWDLVEGNERDDDTLGGTLSWGDSDDLGRFAIPVHLPTDAGEVQLRLEVLANSGESLLELDISFDPSEGLEIGDLSASKPDENWGEEVKLEDSRARSFERPLS
jgi:hypothetical protein